MLDNKDIVSTLQQQARTLFNDPKNAEADKVLKHIFNTNLKTYLPQYYYPNGERRTPEEVKAYHLKMRWDTSSDFLSSKIFGIG